jgi:hypothetical protein
MKNKLKKDYGLKIKDSSIINLLRKIQKGIRKKMGYYLNGKIIKREKTAFTLFFFIIKRKKYNP